MSKKYCLVYLCVMCSVLASMDKQELKKNVVMQQELMHKNIESFDYEHKDVLNSKLLDKNSSFVLHQRIFGDVPCVEVSKPSRLLVNEQVIVKSSGFLSYMDPVKIVIALWGFFTSKEVPCVDSKKNDWENPFIIDTTQSVRFATTSDGVIYVALRDNEKVVIYDLKARREIIKHIAQTIIENSYWSPDRLFYVVWEKSAGYIYNVKTGIKKEIPQGARNGFFWKKSEQDIRFAARFNDKIVIIELLTDGKPTTIQHDGCLIENYAGGNDLVAVQYDNKKIIFYDFAQNNKPVFSLQGQKNIELCDDRFHKNVYIVVAVDDVLKIFDRKTGSQIYSQPQKSIKNMRVTWSDNLRCCTVKAVDELTIHDLKTQKAVMLVSPEGRFFGYDGFNKSETYFCNVSTDIQTGDEIRIYDVTKEDGKPVKIFNIGDKSPQGFFSPNDFFISPRIDNIVEVYDCKTRTSSFKPHDGKRFQWYRNDGQFQYFFVWSLDAKTVIVFDAQTQNEKKLTFEHGIQGAMFDQKYDHLIVNSDKKLHVYEMKSGVCITVIDMKSDIQSMSVSRDGKWLSVCPEANPKSLMIYDIENKYKPALSQPLVFDSEIENHYSPFDADVFQVDTQAHTYIYSVKNNETLLMNVDKK